MAQQLSTDPWPSIWTMLTQVMTCRFEWLCIRDVARQGDRALETFTADKLLPILVAELADALHGMRLSSHPITYVPVPKNLPLKVAAQACSGCPMEVKGRKGTAAEGME